ncbi:MAG: tripartite tricarboxylate transporter substrate binding protein [Variibacter sp.]|nr:tripartite tricarboxylate transporter substrate binding protein [Variibacter sp.]
MARRRFRRAAALALFVLQAAPNIGAAQQDLPDRPITIVIPDEAGSSTDLLARALAAGLERRLSREIVLVNRPGAGGALGALEVARAEPDGSHLLFAPAFVVSVLPAARPDLGYDALALAPVCQTFSNVLALVVRRDSPFASLADLVGAAREAPGQLTYGHPGPATLPHLAMEELGDAASIELVASSYPGDAAALAGLRGGHTDVATVMLGSAAGQDVRIIGLFAEERHPAFPDVPTVKEQGFDITHASFGGLMAPAATPPRIVNRLAAACETAAREEPYAATAKRLGQPSSYYANVATFRHRLQRDIEEKRRLLARLGAAQ